MGMAEKSEKGFEKGLVRIIETQKINLKNPILVEGFPGVGMIGTAAMMYLVRELDMELCGYIVSEKFPPFVAIHEGIPLPPARIYKSEKHNLIVVLSEFAIPLAAVNEICSDLIEWAKEKGVKALYSLGGIDMKVPGADIDRVFGVATTPEMKSKIEEGGITIIKEGITTGVAGVLLARGYMEKFPVISLLTPSRPIAIDLLSAAAVLGIFIRLEKLPISTKRLTVEGMKIEAKIKKILSGAKSASNEYRKVEEYTQTYR
jgi:uncharacterized protein